MDQWTQPAGRAQAPAGQPPPPPPSAPPHHYSIPQQPGPPVPYPASPGPVLSSPAPPAMGYPPGPSQPASRAPGRRLAWPGVLALVLVLALTIGVGVQSWLLFSVSSDLDEANQRLDELAQGQSYAGERLDGLEGRASELEQSAGEAFDSEAIAAAVVPSVFMVTAGDAGGTAFAIGEPTEDGGTNLFTNYHVVQGLFENGGREVRLERTNQTYRADIVEVDPDADVAWLRTTSSFTGLAATTGEVRAGQQVIAVGAPLGLNDTVTSGVVSSPEQELPDGSGPWIQFDAAVNPGNSGGPVINSAQEVVGIATAKNPDGEALGFAVPIEVACDLFDIC
jgi:S1-C subfamily serine protease